MCAFKGNTPTYTYLLVTPTCPICMDAMRWWNRHVRDEVMRLAGRKLDDNIEATCLNFEVCVANHNMRNSCFSKRLKKAINFQTSILNRPTLTKCYLGNPTVEMEWRNTHIDTLRQILINYLM